MNDQRRGDLAVLTASKTVSNAALRWVPPFLEVIGRGVGAGLGTMATLLSVGELTGLAALFVGRRVAVDGERRWLVRGLVLAVAGCGTAAAVARAEFFLVGYALLALGLSTFVTASHLWVGRHYPYTERGRALATLETSWAMGILFGAPLAGLLVTWLSWRAPFLVFAVGNLAVTVLVARRLAGRAESDEVAGSVGGLSRPASAPVGSDWLADRAEPALAAGTAPGETAAPGQRGPGEAPLGGASLRGRGRPRVPLAPSARATVATVVLVWFASVAVFVVYGAWFEDAFGFSPALIGVTSVLLGLMELAASGSATVLIDRWGPRRSVRRSIVGMAVSLVAIALAGRSAPLGVSALVLFLGTYEFGFVSGMAMVTEADRLARGTVVGTTHSVGTLLRAGGALCGGWLYDRFGIAAVTLAAGAATALAALTLRRTSRGDLGPRPDR